MDIRQISIRYRQNHDRILVDINTGAGSEVQVWLTRRMSLRLWPLLNRVVIDHFAIPSDAKTDGFVNLAAMGNPTRTFLAELKREESMQKADFSTPRYRSQLDAPWQRPAATQFQRKTGRSRLYPQLPDGPVH